MSANSFAISFGGAGMTRNMILKVIPSSLQADAGWREERQDLNGQRSFPPDRPSARDGLATFALSDQSPWDIGRRSTPFGIRG